MKHLNRIAAVLATAALVVPAVVVAKGPPAGDHGKSGAPHGKAHTPGQHVNKRCKHQPMVGYTYGGTLDASSTADALVINVTHANHFAKALKGTKVTLSADDSHKARYNPSSPFTTPGADLTQYKAQVIGKVGKPKKSCTFENSPVTVRKVVVNGPGEGATGPTGASGPTGPTGNTGEQS